MSRAREVRRMHGATAMKTQSIMFMCLLVGAPIAGCASNPNKEVKEARNEETEAMRARSEQQIEKTKEQQIQGIERSAEQGKTAADTLPEGSEQRAKAQIEMNEARQTFQVQAQARLQKAQARLEEAQRKLQVAGGRAPTSVHDRVDNVSRETAALSTDVSHLSQVTNDSWGAEKKRIEMRLDQIESSVDDVKSKVDDLK
jgi:hypothetical protein